jgi:phage I-like protein
MANFKKRELDMVVDYEHQTHFGETAPAAGWIKDLEVREDGIWARVQWTDRAKEYIKNKEYRYLSPTTWIEKSSGRVLAISDVALTNTPRINGYKPLTNNSQGAGNMDWLEKLRALLGLDEGADAGQAVAAVEKLANSNKALPKLAKLVGLGEKAGGDEVATAIEAKLNSAGQAQAAIPGEVIAALGLSADAGQSEVLGAIKGLREGSSQLEPLQNRIAQLESAEADRQAEELLNKAVSEGKVAPASREAMKAWALKDAKAFAAYVNSAPKVIPVGTSLPPGSDTPTSAGQLDEAQREMNSMFGVSDEAFKKYAAEKEV